MKILVTGFEPFGGASLNPSWQAVSRLPVRIGGAEIIKLRLPTVYDASTLLSAIERERPDAVVCIGVAGGRTAITPELRARNAVGTMRDNEGRSYPAPYIVDGGAEFLPSTLPNAAMTEKMTAAAIPCRLSDTAGNYVCNYTMYRLLEHTNGSIQARASLAGFIHVPDCFAENPPMTLDEIVGGLTVCIECVADKLYGRA